MDVTNWKISTAPRPFRDSSSILDCSLDSPKMIGINIAAWSLAIYGKTALLASIRMFAHSCMATKEEGTA